MAIKTNKAARSYEGDTYIGYPAFIGIDAGPDSSLREAYRGGTGIAANNRYERGRRDSRFSEDYREGPRFADSRFSEDYGEGLPFI